MAKDPNMMFGYEGDKFVRRKLNLSGVSAYSYGQKFIGTKKGLGSIFGSAQQITPRQANALRRSDIVVRKGLSLKLERPHFIARVRQRLMRK